MTSLLSRSVMALGLAASLLLTAPAFAEEAQALLPGSVNLELIEGSTVPEDCQYPETISDTATFELACVTMPRASSGYIAAEYIGQLGEHGWVQGDYVTGGLTAVRTDEHDCRHVLNIFPSDFPRGDRRSANVVIWFALEREPRCTN